MSLYARIQNGVVAELFTAPAGYTLAQCFHADLIASFIAIDGISPPPRQGWSFTAPATFTVPAPPAPPTVAQQATAALAAGVQIVSTGTPALNGTYPCDPTAQARLASTATFINTNSKFPGSNPTQISWPDMAMQPHVFTTIEGFLEFASAVENHVTHLYEVSLGQVTTLPAQPVTIA